MSEKKQTPAIDKHEIMPSGKQSGSLDAMNKSEFRLLNGLISRPAPIEEPSINKHQFSLLNSLIGGSTEKK